LEQAKILQSQILKNRKIAYCKAILQQLAIICAYLTTLVCAIAWIAFKWQG
jgi:hypothetical protein